LPPTPPVAMIAIFIDTSPLSPKKPMYVQDQTPPLRGGRRWSFLMQSPSSAESRANRR
jgi:hypothetical protein